MEDNFIFGIKKLNIYTILYTTQRYANESYLTVIAFLIIR